MYCGADLVRFTFGTSLFFFAFFLCVEEDGSDPSIEEVTVLPVTTAGFNLLVLDRIDNLGLFSVLGPSMIDKISGRGKSCSRIGSSNSKSISNSSSPSEKQISVGISFRRSRFSIAFRSSSVVEVAAKNVSSDFFTDFFRSSDCFFRSIRLR